MEPTLLLPALASAGDTLSDAVRWLIELPVTIFRAYSSLLGWAADEIRDLFDAYGYWVVFFGTLFENTLLLGLIIPGVIVVLLAGISAQDGAMNPYYAIALGIIGTIIGDTLSYLMGRFGWTRIGKGEQARAFAEKVREPLLRRGIFFVLVYHFAGYTRIVGPAAAGLLGMPYRRWAPADHIGAALWVTSFFGLGYALGAAGVTLDSTDKYFRYVEWGLLIVVGFWGYVVFKSSQKAIMSRLHDVLHADEALDASATPDEDDDQAEPEAIGSSARP